MKKLSIIIPSYNRDELLIEAINKIINGFEIINYNNYEIICVVSGGTKKIALPSYNDKVNIFYFFNEKLDPGEARNFGLSKSNSEWIWFVDDDDELFFQSVKSVIDLINKSEFDLIAHSLKLSYDSSDKYKLLKNIATFRDKQEVFNFVFKKEIVEKNKIKFSDGLHEDIKYVIQLLLQDIQIIILNDKIYNKITREDSVTKKLNNSRINGYIKAIGDIINIENEELNNIKSEIVTQCLGTMLYLINSTEHNEKMNLLIHLENKFTENLKNFITRRYNKKSSNFRYAVSLFLNKTDNDKFINDLDYCFKSYLSCKDLKNSIFLGPQEIIGCCKRFFYDGKMKGDIVLMPNSNDVTLEKILDKKKKVENLINMDSYEECEGCPYIERYEKTQNEKVNYISLENFTYCNMRCNYCSPKYYGGREPSYDTENIIDELLSGDYLANGTHIVWGGGEPTLKPKFKEITQSLLDSDKISKIRVLSNSLKFSENLYEIAGNEKIRIVTSIDAGTQEKFKEVRGKGDIHKVLENLKKYKKNINSEENLTIKYIMTEDNYFIEELKEFVNLLKHYEFEDNLIQISCNFMLEEPTQEMIYSIYELAGLLLNNGFQFIFFDDLIRDRLKLDKSDAEKVINHLNKNNLMHENIVSHLSDICVILWGDGYQSKWIKNKTNFGRANKISKIISNKLELDIEDVEENMVICPAAIQSLPEIYKEIKKSNLENQTKFLIFV